MSFIEASGMYTRCTLPGLRDERGDTTSMLKKSCISSILWLCSPGYIRSKNNIIYLLERYMIHTVKPRKLILFKYYKSYIQIGITKGVQCSGYSLEFFFYKYFIYFKCINKSCKNICNIFKYFLYCALLYTQNLIT